MLKGTNVSKSLLIRALGIIICICPVVCAILSYFPLWIARDDACALSGIALCLILIALIPFYKYIIRALKSPSAHTMWFIVFVIFFFLSKISDEMTVIAFVGFISNLFGAMIFKLGKRYGGRKDDE